MAPAAVVKRKGDVSSEVLSADDTWNVKESLPFFDSRLIVDTCAQLVASSFQIRHHNATTAVAIAKPKTSGELAGGPGTPGGGNAGVLGEDAKAVAKRRAAAAATAPLLQVLTSHAQGFTGAARFATELVPRCRPFREQLKQTVQPMCVDGSGPTTLTSSSGIAYEVDRFLRARLVTVDLAELLEFDCFAATGPDDFLLKHFSNFAGKLPDDIEEDEEPGNEKQNGGKKETSRIGFATDNFEAFFLATGGDKAGGGDLLAQVATKTSRTASAFQAAANAGASAVQARAARAALGGSVAFGLRAPDGASGAGMAATAPPQSSRSAHMTSMNSFMSNSAAPPPANLALQQGKAERDMELFDELSVKRFELRFWRAFVNALARSMFGASRSDLVFRFEASAQEVFDRYEGELQLAMNSMMGWLPSWVSDSLFIAFVGLSASAAVRQPAKKYTLLHRCLRCLTHSSGRYIFVATPGWYMPLVSFLPGVGPRERVRTLPGQMPIGLRMVWPSACVGPADCIRAVDKVWGGRIPTKRAALRLCKYVEPMGTWVLRATLGCDRLLGCALDTMAHFGPIFEECYDTLLEEGIFSSVDLPVDSELARDVAEAAAAMILKHSSRRRRSSAASARASMMRPTPSQQQVSFREGSALSKRGQHSRRFSITEAAPTDEPPVGLMDSLVRRFSSDRNSAGRLSSMMGPSRSRASVARSTTYATMGSAGAAEEEDDGFSQSILERLHQESHGHATMYAADIGQCRLRKSVFAGVTDDLVGEPLRWPVGEGLSGGRIPIHDSPELRPTATPPTLDPDLVFGDLDLDGSKGAPATSPASPRSARVQVPRTSERRITFVAEKGSARSGRDSRRRRTGAGFSSLKSNIIEEPVKKERPELGPRPPDPDDWVVRFGRRARSEPRAPPHKRKLGNEEMSLEELRDQILASTSGSATWLKATRPRPSSAPPAVDTADFDTGNPHRSTAIALALQSQLRSALSSICVEGPIHLAWRRPRADEDVAQLIRGRFTLGVALLFAAVKAPLPTLSDMSLERFLAFECKEAFSEVGPKQSSPWPDAIYAIGCMPLFCSGATELSAPTAPLMSMIFRVGVPHAILEDAVNGNVLLDKQHWTEGSLLVLFATALSQVNQRMNSDWYKVQNWMAMDHLSFASSLCIFRFLLGIEYLSFWRLRRSAYIKLTLGEFLPFLNNGKVRAASADFRIDMSAADGQRPFLAAPWVSPTAQGTPDFDPAKAEWSSDHLLCGTTVPLQDFARWVAGLKPGRIVHSSVHSPTADLYLRLRNTVVVMTFACLPSMSANLEPVDVNKMYREAVGKAQWWGDNFVTFIVLCNKLGRALDAACSDGTCMVLQHGGDNLGCPEIDVMPQSEVVVCHPASLKALLGALELPLGTHQRMYESEVKWHGNLKPRVDKNAKSRRASAKALAGAARNVAADWRSKRPQLPKQSLLDLNVEILKALTAHVHAHTTGLDQLVQELNQTVESDEDGSSSDGIDDDDGSSDDGLDDASSGSNAKGSRCASPPAEGTLPTPSGQPSSKQQPLSEAAVAAMLGGGRERVRRAAQDFLLTGRTPGKDFFESAQVARINPREVSPKRTQKSRDWRPPTPHPSQAPEQAWRQRKRKELQAASSAQQEDEIKERQVDFLGIDTLKPVDLDAERAARLKQRDPRRNS